MPLTPRSIEAAHTELDTLGPYVSGEPQATSRRRAFVQRWVRQYERGRYADPSTLPATEDAARRELTTLGAYVLGEPGRVSRRRAAIVRAHPGLGAHLARLELEALGEALDGEPWAVTQRRDKLYRRAHRLPRARMDR